MNRSNSQGGSEKIVSNATNRAFSLIELMVVVAIMAVLFGLGAATLTSRKSQEISSAGGMVYDLANVARQHALSKNTKTVLVVAEVNQGGTPHSALSVWDAANTNQLEKWEVLPDPLVATNTSGFSVPGGFSCKFRGSTITAQDVYVFYPDGRMTDDFSQKPRLRVKARVGEVGNYYDLVFNPFTGNSKIERP